MAIVLPAIEGKMGTTTYYESVMKARELVSFVRLPNQTDEWANMSIEDRIQRDPDHNRIRKDLAPYVANKTDRFFGSVILLMQGDMFFEPFSKISHNLPIAYQSVARRVGVITIDDGTSIVLDGQHRILAIQKVLSGDITGSCSIDEVGDDQLSVIFIDGKDQKKEKIRRIFNTVNRYAKQTSRGDNIITSEDDGYAIISRKLLSSDLPLNASTELVKWKSNTLARKSTNLTTICAIYESTKLILEYQTGHQWYIHTRPNDKDIESGLDRVTKFWGYLLKGIDAFQEAVKYPSSIPKLRSDEGSKSLLFKPVAQIALIEGILLAIKNGNLELSEAIKRANAIPYWSKSHSIWEGVIVKKSGLIDASREARNRASSLICYLISADKLDHDMLFSAWKAYNYSRGKDFDVWLDSNGSEGSVEDLPQPVKGYQFTKSDAISPF